jgi:hypothetical protein
LTTAGITSCVWLEVKAHIASSNIFFMDMLQRITAVFSGDGGTAPNSMKGWL